MIVHISIEGVDGVGKTTIAQALAKSINFVYVEKPFSHVFDEAGLDNYLSIKKGLKKLGSKKTSCWFYGMNLVFASEFYKGRNVVFDRGLVSNYAWLLDDSITDIFDLSIKIAGTPDFTFLLIADGEVLRKRLSGRDGDKGDLYKAEFQSIIQSKMIELLNRSNAKYAIIDRTNLGVEETVQAIVSILRKQSLL